MPFDNRYVVVAVDSQGEHLAFYSPESNWIASARDAICFPSQMDAQAFIATNGLDDLSAKPDCQKTVGNLPSELKNIDRVESLFVTADHLNSALSEERYSSASLAGLCG